MLILSGLNPIIYKNKSSSPVAPTGLTVTSSGNGTIVLSWNASSGATSYDLQSSLDNSTWSTISTAQPGTNFTDEFTAGAAGFNSAANQSLSVANNSTLQMNGTSFTICGFVNFSTFSVQEIIVNKYATGANAEYRVSYIDANGSLTFFLNSDTINSGTNSITVKNNWYFFVAWYDSVANTLNIQVNTNAVQSKTFAGSDSGAETNTFFLGLTAGGTNGLSGSMDRIRLWKRVLTAGEITALYNSGNGLQFSQLSSSLLTSLVASWDLNPANFLTDSSTSGNTLTNNAGVFPTFPIVASSANASGIKYYRVRANGSSGSSAYTSSVNASPWLIKDIFTDVNGTNLPAHIPAPINTPANSYSASGASGSDLQIQSNICTVEGTSNSGTQAIGNISCGQANSTVLATVNMQSTSGEGPIVRYGSATSFYLAQPQAGSTSFTIYEYTGSYVSRASSTLSITTSASTDYIVRMNVSGSNITAVMYDSTGVTVYGSVTYGSATTNPSSTQIGMRADHISDLFKLLQVTSP